MAYIINRVYLPIGFVYVPSLHGTRGLELRLPEIRITQVDIDNLLHGEAVTDPDTGWIIDPLKHQIHLWQLALDGSILADQGTMTARETLEHLCSIPKSGPGHSGVLIILPHPDSSYQDVVSALDATWELKFVTEYGDNYPHLCGALMIASWDHWQHDALPPLAVSPALPPGGIYEKDDRRQWK